MAESAAPPEAAAGGLGVSAGDDEIERILAQAREIEALNRSVKVGVAGAAVEEACGAGSAVSARRGKQAGSEKLNPGAGMAPRAVRGANPARTGAGPAHGGQRLFPGGPAAGAALARPRGSGGARARSPAGKGAAKAEGSGEEAGRGRGEVGGRAVEGEGQGGPTVALYSGEVRGSHAPFLQRGAWETPRDDAAGRAAAGGAARETSKSNAPGARMEVARAKMPATATARATGASPAIPKGAVAPQDSGRAGAGAAGALCADEAAEVEADSLREAWAGFVRALEPHQPPSGVFARAGGAMLGAEVAEAAGAGLAALLDGTPSLAACRDDPGRVAAMAPAEASFLAELLACAEREVAGMELAAWAGGEGRALLARHSAPAHGGGASEGAGALARGGADATLPVWLELPGCRPHVEALLDGLAKAPGASGGGRLLLERSEDLGRLGAARHEAQAAALEEQLALEAAAQLMPLLEDAGAGAEGAALEEAERQQLFRFLHSVLTHGGDRACVLLSENPFSDAAEESAGTAGQE